MKLKHAYGGLIISLIPNVTPAQESPASSEVKIISCIEESVRIVKIPEAQLNFDAYTSSLEQLYEGSDASSIIEISTSGKMLKKNGGKVQVILNSRIYRRESEPPFHSVEVNSTGAIQIPPKNSSYPSVTYEAGPSEYSQEIIEWARKTTTSALQAMTLAFTVCAGFPLYETPNNESISSPDFSRIFSLK